MADSGKYVAISNRNTTEENGWLDPDYLLFMGASSDRGLTGQGMGFKFVVADCLRRGMEIARASWDKEGSYIAHFFSQPKQINGREQKQICMRIERPGQEDEVRETTTLVRIADHSWSHSPLGDDYSMLREPVLDAADEDAAFKIETRDVIEYAPEGYTITYLSATPQLAQAVELFAYYFKRSDQVGWIGDRVGVTDVGSVNEHRFFITVQGASLAYVAYTSGDAVGNDPAYDYVLKELPSDTLASPPKRLVEDPPRAQNMIRDSWYRCKEPALLARVFANIKAGGLESNWHWSSSDWEWADKGVIRKAFGIAFGPWPITDHDDSLGVLEARLSKKKFTVVGEALFRIGKMAGVQTLAAALGVRHKEESVIRQLTTDERALVNTAIRLLEAKFGGDFRRGHLFMALDSEKHSGFHIPDYGGADVIALRFDDLDPDYSREFAVAQKILHEIAHHVDEPDQSTKSWDAHHIGFAEALMELTLGRAG